MTTTPSTLSPSRLSRAVAALCVLLWPLARRFAAWDMQQWLWETWRFVKMIFPLLIVGVFLVGEDQPATIGREAYGARIKLAGCYMTAHIIARNPPAGVLPQGAPVSSESAGGVSVSYAVRQAAPGETVCGDAWAVVQDDHRAAIIVADGLGHGPLAAEASQAAVSVFPMAVNSTTTQNGLSDRT